MICIVTDEEVHGLKYMSRENSFDAQIGQKSSVLPKLFLICKRDKFNFQVRNLVVKAILLMQH